VKVQIKGGIVVVKSLCLCRVVCQCMCHGMLPCVSGLGKVRCARVSLL
jgi:hypothetical protein